MSKLISIRTSDNVTLACKYWKINANGPLVVFIHQYSTMGGQSTLMDGMAKECTKYGYNAITFDLRLHSIDNIMHFSFMFSCY